MEVEKRGSRGGFLNFFDWGGKSRKKLFSNHSDVPDGLKKGKENFENSSISRYRLIEYDENRSVSSRKASSEYNYASSIASDEGCRSEVPGVVARLMGLDSMPTANACEPCSSSFIDSHSEYIHRGSNVNSQNNYHIMDYQNMYYKLEEFSTNPTNSTPKKMQARPIEKFQSEMLPPKSAKTIPVTHHKLLSPIKSPGFIQTKNAAYIMEAASKIIESSPRASAYGKMPSGGYSSVPFRIRDMKEKMEASQKSARPQRPKESDTVKNVRGQMQPKNNGLYSGREDTTVKIYKDLGKVNSGNLKDKGKSVSLAEQAKSNVQRREGAASTGNRTPMGYKESNGVKSKQSIQGIQSTTEKGVQKRTSKRPSSVLQMNNQKQNNLVNKDNHASRNMTSNQQVRKSLSSNGSVENKKAVTKVASNSQLGPKKKGLMLAGTGKEQSSSRVKNSPHNIRPITQGNPLEGSFSDNVLIKKDGMSIKCYAVVDGCTNGALGGRKDCMDIVSFTFSSPIKKPLSGSDFSGQGIENSDKSDVHSSYSHSQLLDSEFSKSSSLGLNAIAGDGLSILLEQKIKELAGKIESSQGNVGEAQPAASSQSSLQDSLTFCDQGSSTSMENESSQDGLLGNLDNEYDSDSSSLIDMQLKRNQRWQGFDEVEEQSSLSGKSECSKELDPEHLTPTSCSEVYSNGSFHSSQSIKNYGQGDKCLLSGRNEAINLTSGEESCSESPEWTISRIAASSSTNIDKKNTVPEPRSSVSMRPTNWELKYVREILSISELMVQDFVLGQSNNVIPPHLFDGLENREVNGVENSKIERKLLFDLVSEFVNLRFKQFPIGRGEMLSKVSSLSQSKGLLAENLYKEISTLRSMEDLMVDEIVDKDMSTGNGRWVEFDIEALEEGVEIENSILLSLIDELVADVFP